MADPEVPDVYADGVGVSVGPFGVTISLYLTEPPAIDMDNLDGAVGRVQAVPRLVGRVRLGHALASSIAETIPKALADSPPPAASVRTKAR